MNRYSRNIACCVRNKVAPHMGETTETIENMGKRLNGVIQTLQLTRDAIEAKLKKRTERNLKRLVVTFEEQIDEVNRQKVKHQEPISNRKGTWRKFVSKQKLWTGASLGNSGRGVQGQIFRHKGVVVEIFFRIRAWHTLQLMIRDELTVITLERCHGFLFINERNNQRQVIPTIETSLTGVLYALTLVEPRVLQL